MCREITVSGRFDIREMRPAEAKALGQLMVAVYSQLDGFPTPEQQPDYYTMLGNIGRHALRPRTQVLVAHDLDSEQLLGGVVYFGDMAEYGSRGAATQVRNASGIRLLGVSPEARGQGVGTALTVACIDRAMAAGHREVVLHTTHAMQVAWTLYERLGFVRSEDLDFSQGALPVFGFRLRLRDH